MSDKKLSVHVLIMEIIIGIAIIGTIVLVAVKTGTATEVGVTMLLSTGLAIIGCAIAIWAGLNISSSISRKEMDDSKRSLSELNDSVKEAKTDLAESRKRQLLNSIRSVSSVDYFSMFFVEAIEEIKVPEDEQLDDEAWDFAAVPSLIRIDSMYMGIFSRHNKEKRDFELAVMTKKCYDEINKLDTNKLPDIIKQYLKHRLAEVIFHEAYTPKSSAQKLYEKTIKSYEWFIDFFEERAKRRSEYYNELKMKAYLNNTLGESYSMMMQQKLDKSYDSQISLDEIFKNGEKAFQNVLDVLKDWPEFERETYYRNYACFYMRYDKLVGEKSHISIIAALFDKAIHVQAEKEETTKKRVYQEPLKYFKMLGKDITTEASELARQIALMAIEIYPENKELLELSALFLDEEKDNKQLAMIKKRLEFLSSDDSSKIFEHISSRDADSK